MTTVGRVPNCIFCAGEGRILARGEHTFLRLDDSPVVLGHALLCPIEHYPSFADLPPAVVADARKLLDDVAPEYSALFGEPILFEHGRTAHCVARDPAERFCHHAHLHLLPCTVDIGPRVAASSTPWGSPTLEELAHCAGLEDGYLFVATPGGRLTAYRVDRPLPSHFLRRCVAAELGQDELADWSSLLESERSRELMDDAATMFNAVLPSEDVSR